MLVRNYMSRHLVKVPAKYPLLEAAGLMFEHHISHLPVVEKGLLKGIVSNRDLKRAWSNRLGKTDPDLFWAKIQKMKVVDIMTSAPLHIMENESVENAAIVMQKNWISSLPVLDASGRLKAMISLGDVFRALMQAKGFSHECMISLCSNIVSPKTGFEQTVKIPFA
jgi:acetoin utilization protein AcuB